MNRGDRIRLLAALDAMAGAIRLGLKAEAAEEYDREGMTPTWKAEGVTVSSSQSHDHAEIVDMDELMAYLVAEHPEMVMTVVVPRNPDHLKAWLNERAAEGPIASRAATLKPGESAPLAAAIPGAVFVRGGVFGTISVKVDSGVKRDLSKRATALLAGEAAPGLGGVFATAQRALEADE
jgi:hypothetical protein